ncbi:helix-turn-helix domain-containing protein [Pedobacter hartonius]|uniref:Helix-turn-helix domain-containing protein n=1 Tax=Pedobacter hartonius TaxID=425514 RepID=A0A1H4CMY5_9SPHI|nr:helix-turn-helix transcriptional regulator [Pedobacter hartonius]SEA61815.1 Helix-turn-helix domain-containing protein [Pedobacter hartonius]
MKKKNNSPLKFDSISDAHQAFGLPRPPHPLISLINTAGLLSDAERPSGSHLLNFYKISLRTKLSGSLRYGQGYYDFAEGGLLFAAPNQLIGSSDNESKDGISAYVLLIHPDFFTGYPLAKNISQYGFFSYSTNEALHLSEREKATIVSTFKLMEEELNNRIDDFSQEVIVTQIELLLNYAKRFYKRQFITRRPASNALLQKFELVLDEYFSNEKSLSQGVPTVQYLAENLNISPNYLSDMLRSLTGQSAQQHIHDKLIAKAKEKLSTTNLSVSQVAYVMGFEHSQSFSKLFKLKTKVSPLAFKRSFN